MHTLKILFLFSINIDFSPTKNLKFITSKNSPHNKHLPVNLNEHSNAHKLEFKNSQVEKHNISGFETSARIQ